MHVERPIGFHQADRINSWRPICFPHLAFNSLFSLTFKYQLSHNSVLPQACMIESLLIRKNELIYRGSISLMGTGKKKKAQRIFLMIHFIS